MTNRQPKGAAGSKGGQFAPNRVGATKVPTAATVPSVKKAEPSSLGTVKEKPVNAASNGASTSLAELVEAQIKIDAILSEANQRFEEITNEALSNFEASSGIPGFSFAGAKVVAKTKIGSQGFEVTYDLRFPPAYNDPKVLADQMIAASMVKLLLERESIAL